MFSADCFTLFEVYFLKIKVKTLTLMFLALMKAKYNIDSYLVYFYLLGKCFGVASHFLIGEGFRTL